MNSRLIEILAKPLNAYQWVVRHAPGSFDDERLRPAHLQLVLLSPSQHFIPIFLNILTNVYAMCDPSGE
jgi:hypothetical protein